MGISNTIPPSRLIQPGVVANTAARPSSPFTGQAIYQVDTNQMLIWNGTAWVIPNSPAQNPTGLELIKTATVTNAADTSTTWQSVFTSTYDSYRLVVKTVTAHTNGSVPRLLFYYGTSTEQASTYYGGVINALYNGTSNVTSVNNGASIPLTQSCDNLGMSSCSIDFHACGYSARASCLTQFSNAYDGAFSSGGGYVNTTQTYTGFKLFMSAGNISMTGSLYGYRK